MTSTLTSMLTREVLLPEEDATHCLSKSKCHITKVTMFLAAVLAARPCFCTNNHHRHAGSMDCSVSGHEASRSLHSETLRTKPKALLQQSLLHQLMLCSSADDASWKESFAYCYIKEQWPDQHKPIIVQEEDNCWVCHTPATRVLLEAAVKDIALDLKVVPQPPKLPYFIMFLT